jgi:zinc finger protein
MDENEENADVLTKQPCPMCGTKSLTLREAARDIPFVGMTYIFSMDCSNCEYRMSDVEVEGSGKPVKYSIEIDSEEDLNIRVVKSSSATIKIPRLAEITPGPISDGFVSNVEGVINRIKKVIESKKDDDDPSVRKSAKNQLKKIQKVLWGQEKLTIHLIDPNGNSAIVSDKAKKS